VKFQRASDDELRECGWDPAQIDAHDDGEEGPFVVARISNAVCGQCGHATVAWTVVNLATATGISEEWTHGDAECDADEKASELNAAWLAGYESAAQKETHSGEAFDRD